MSKYAHILTINKVSENFVEYIYNYGSTKEITLMLSEMGFSISAQLTRVYDEKEMLLGNTYLFPDAIRKAMLLYLIKYGKALSIETITVKIADEIAEYSFEKCEPPVYSMINGILHRKIHKSFSNEEVFKYLLNTPKTKYDKRIASLFALLMSKSKDYETERFIYLWASFNGMYSWLSELIARKNKIDKYRKENKLLINFQKYLGVGEETILEGDKVIIARKVVSILKDVNIGCVKKRDIDGNLSERITSVLYKSTGEQYNLTAYGYLLTQFSYYFRCKIFHGSKPIFLFSYADDDELHSLKIINDLLEEFIDTNLPLWFEESYGKEKLENKIKDIK